MSTTEYNINEIKLANKKLAEAANSIVWLPPQPDRVVLEIKLPESVIKQPLIRGAVPPHRLPCTQTIAVVGGYLVDSEVGELGPGQTISYKPEQLRGFNFWGTLLVSFTPPLKSEPQ